MRRLLWITLGLGLTTLAACEEKKPAAAVDTAPTAGTPYPVAAKTNPPPPADGVIPGQGTVAHANAKALFAQRCTLCHGMDGRGTGPAAANLNPKPRDYSDAKWQASVKDEDLAKTIVEGGAAVGKSMMMPPNPDLKDKPEEVAELVKIVRGFKK